MSKDRNGLGFADQLLNRADGHFEGPRPRIANIFTAEDRQHSEPLAEWTEQSIAQSPTPVSRDVEQMWKSENEYVLENLVQSEAVNEPHVPDSAPNEKLIAKDISETRLMPALSKAEIVPERPGRKLAQADASAINVEPPLPKTDTRKQPELEPSRQPRKEPVIKRDSKPVGRQLRPDISIHEAVAQLLGRESLSAENEHVEANVMISERSSSDASFNTKNLEIKTDEKLPGESEAPLTIHIGEVIVAPETATEPGREVKSEKWQPPLSLDDYRAARARERR